MFPEPFISESLDSESIVSTAEGWSTVGGRGDTAGSVILAVGVGAEGDDSPVAVDCPPPPGVDPPGGCVCPGAGDGVRLGQV